MYPIRMLELTTEENAVRVPVKIVPGASRTRYLGIWRGRARIAVSAPPERGKANEAVAKYLAGLLGVRKRDVAVVAGHASPIKTIRIEGVTLQAVLAALDAPEPDHR